MNQYSDKAKTEFRNAGQQAAQFFIDGITWLPKKIVDLFTGLGSKIAAVIGTIDWSGLLPSWASNLLGGGVQGSVSATPVSTPLSSQGLVGTTDGIVSQMRGEQTVVSQLDPNSKVRTDVYVHVDGPADITNVTNSGSGNAEPGSVGIQELE